VLIAQLTDCHVVEPGDVVADRIDTASRLAAAVDRVLALDPLPDLVLLTGDLVNHGLPAQYDHLEQLLAPLAPLPLVIVPGNHDDRTELRRRFAGLPPGGPDDPLDQVVDDWPVRIVALDTIVPGEHGGRLTADQLAWLDTTLAAEPDRPTIVTQHHPPFRSGIPWMDTYALDGIDRQRAVLARHPHVLAVLAGHFHRTIQIALGPIAAWCAPSTAAQIDRHAPHVTYTDEPGAFALHTVEPASDRGGRTELRTDIVTVGPFDAWRPSWSLV